MHQLTLSLLDGPELGDQLAVLRTRISQSNNPQATPLFRLFNASPDKELSNEAVHAIRQHFPTAPYLGCSSNANIANGMITQGQGAVSIVCDVFEDPGTTVELMQLPLSYENQEDVARQIVAAVAARPAVKAIEILDTVETANLPRLCKKISAVDERIVLFGGGALNWDADFNGVVVFSSAGPTTDHGIVLVFYSGENFHAQTQLVQGWKPLGMPFRITRANRMTLHELNGRPALEIYHHYLQFSEDDDFLKNGLCFPICIECEGEQVMRTPIAKGPDGSIVMPTDVSDVEGDCRIAYGDPLAIRQSVHECLSSIQAFCPQAILAFACIARLLYWGTEYASLEMQPLLALAPAAGFYTGGELVRQGRALLHHNLALVLVGLREGPPANRALVRKDEEKPMELSLQLSLIGHMASFIGAASQELQEAYERMDAIARTDDLTGLANRREVEDKIVLAVEAHDTSIIASPIPPPCLIMLDLDNFKQVNDTFGHEAGDEVLRRLAAPAQTKAQEHPHEVVFAAGVARSLWFFSAIPPSSTRCVLRSACARSSRPSTLARQAIAR